MTGDLKFLDPETPPSSSAKMLKSYIETKNAFYSEAYRELQMKD